ncbi:hypothetical protein TUN199_08992 [Pyrenophora tritici-repentis]|nr:hypothetical protein Alg130_01802 [Pyrenophora tritici-repentis]KAI0613969.1 hypothetical protein TUN205_01758 [Pyrenophora tritici-repentis]KAI0619025.1 hypothetical protein TUN199_08992 [Pyrenophora tritici-repentis]
MFATIMNATFEFAHKDVFLATVFTNFCMYLTLILFWRAKGLSSVSLAILFLIGVSYVFYMIGCNLLVLSDATEDVEESPAHPRSPQWVVDRILRVGQILRGELMHVPELEKESEPEPVSATESTVPGIEAEVEPELEADHASTVTEVDATAITTTPEDMMSGEAQAELETLTNDVGNKILAIADLIRGYDDLVDAILKANELSKLDEPSDKEESPEENLNVALVLYQPPRDIVDIIRIIPSKDTTVEGVATATPLEEEVAAITETTTITDNTAITNNTATETPALEEEIIEVEMPDAPKEREVLTPSAPAKKRKGSIEKLNESDRSYSCKRKMRIVKSGFYQIPVSVIPVVIVVPVPSQDEMFIDDNDTKDGVTVLATGIEGLLLKGEDVSDNKDPEGDIEVSEIADEGR